MKLYIPRRPFVFITAASIIGIAFCYIFSPEKYILLIGLAFSLLLILFTLASDTIIKKAFFPLLLSMFFFAFSLYAHSSFTQIDPLEEFIIDSKQTMPLASGRVISISDKSSGTREFIVISEGNMVLVKTYYESNPPDDKTALIGKQIQFKGKVTYPDTSKNPKGFDYRLYLLSKDIRVIVTCKPNAISIIEKSETTNSIKSHLTERIFQIYNYAFIAKSKFAKAIEKHMSDENAALFTGMMFGDVENISEDTYKDFQRTGIAHILSVSGLHIGMLYSFVILLFRKRKTKSIYFSILIILFIYMILSEFAPPVVRSVIMISVHIIAKMQHKRFDLLTAIAISAFIMLLINPLQLFGTGFILSYLAVTALSFSLPFSSRYFGYRHRYTQKSIDEKSLLTIYKFSGTRLFFSQIATFLIPMLVIQFMLIPITAYYFNYVSLVSVLLNIPVIALSSLIIPLGLFVLLFSCLNSLPLFSFLSEIAVGVLTESTEIMTSAILYLTNIAGNMSYGSIDVISPPIQLIFIFYAFGFFLMSESFIILIGKKKYREFTIKSIGIALACILTILSPVCQINNGAYTFVDVGQGDCLHIKTPDGKNYLLDGGGKPDFNTGEKILKPYLLKNGVKKLDGIFISHLHTDHFKGLVELSQIYDVGNVFLYKINKYRSLEITIAENEKPLTLKSDRIYYLKAGDTVSIGKNAFAETLFPPALSANEYKRMLDYEEDENKSSLIVRFNNSNISVLMTGDLTSEGELELINYTEVNSDILKIAHHGSKFSTEERFLKAVNPKATIIQVGKNNYGHPSQSVLDKLTKNDIITYRNDIHGAIIIDKIDSSIAIKTNKDYFVSKMLIKQPYVKQLEKDDK